MKQTRIGYKITSKEIIAGPDAQPISFLTDFNRHGVNPRQVLIGGKGKRGGWGVWGGGQGRTCAERLVQISRRRSVPALAKLGPQLVVRRFLAVQHLQRLNEAKANHAFFFPDPSDHFN